MERRRLDTYVEDQATTIDIGDSSVFKLLRQASVIGFAVVEKSGIGIDVGLLSLVHGHVFGFHHQIFVAFTAPRVLNSMAGIQHLWMFCAICITQQGHLSEGFECANTLFFFQLHLAIIGALNEGAVLMRVPIIGNHNAVKLIAHVVYNRNDFFRCLHGQCARNKVVLHVDDNECGFPPNRLRRRIVKSQESMKLVQTDGSTLVSVELP
mmetsp:Transcript_23347/g.50835  ORF Transcript_23347/g.50835 Transcript_23347/m.50835 type:complete len:209 (-) Transcript_23347:218-844(-)